jgi:hypothetical protein
VRGVGLALEGVSAIYAAVCITNQSTTFAIDREIIEVEQISSARAGRSLQADGALLNRIIWCGVGGNPVRAAIVGGSDVKVPDIGAIEGGAVRVAGPAGSDGRAGAKEGERGAIIVSGNYNWKHRMSNTEGRTDIDRC